MEKGKGRWPRQIGRGFSGISIKLSTNVNLLKCKHALREHGNKRVFEWPNGRNVRELGKSMVVFRLFLFF